MGDNIAEVLVKQKPTFASVLQRICVILGAFVVLFAAPSFSLGLQIPQLMYLVGPGAILAIWGGAKVFSLCSVEYEYCVVSGELTIDKIRGKLKRKRLIKVDCHKFEEFGKCENQLMQNVLDVSGKQNRYYAVFRADNGEKVTILFSPSEKMLKLISIYSHK